MVYQGSKAKIANELKPIIESYLKQMKENNKEGYPTCYYEPFVGGANMIDKIEWEYKYGHDNNVFLIALLRWAQETIMWDGKLPVLDCSRSEYHKYRDLYNFYNRNPKEFFKRYLDTNDEVYWKVGYYGFLMSYNGRFFDGGYGVVINGDKNSFITRLKNLEKQAKQNTFQDIAFDWGDFGLLVIWNSVIYCDIPYKDTKGYRGKKFDYERFYKQCEKWKQDGNTVLLSEKYEHPGFKEIWRKEIKHTLGANNMKNAVEKLFIYTGEN